MKATLEVIQAVTVDDDHVRVAFGPAPADGDDFTIVDRHVELVVPAKDLDPEIVGATVAVSLRLSVVHKPKTVHQLAAEREEAEAQAAADAAAAAEPEPAKAAK